VDIQDPNIMVFKLRVKLGLCFGRRGIFGRGRGRKFELWGI